MISSVEHTQYYKTVYKQYAPMLISFAQKFVADFYAEDIVHDVFLKLWDKQLFDFPESDIKKILYIAVRNRCIDHLRKINLEKDIIDKRAIQLKLDELHFFESSEDLFMRTDLYELLIKKVEELPEKSREIFKMSYLEGLKATEIADKLNISVRTVENHLYRSLLYIRKKSYRLFLFLFTLI